MTEDSDSYSFDKNETGTKDIKSKMTEKKEENVTNTL